MRPWAPADAAVLPGLLDDPDLRRWTSHRAPDTAAAREWIARQRAGAVTGERTPLAVLLDGAVVGHLVLKRPDPTVPVGEVGYWIGARARGRGLAARAVGLITDWAFSASRGPRLDRLDLIHDVDNAASCAVARKAGYVLAEILPPAPRHPAPAHLHVRSRTGTAS
nr:GNAT family N-acetyltransferase [Streptomyces sp. SID5785]